MVTNTTTVMKNLFRSIALVAAAAMTLASCSKDPVTDNLPAPEQRTLRFTTSEGTEDRPDREIDTRTHFDEQYAVKWDDATDQVGVYIHDTELLGGTSNALGTIERVGTVANFTAQVDAFYANDIFCAYYPYATANNAGAGSVKMTVPAQQEQAETGTFNGTNNPMVAVSHPFTEEEAATGTIKRPVKFRLLGGIAEFAIYTDNAAYNGEVIRSLTFTNSTTEAVAGTFTYDLTAVSETGQPAPIDKSTILADEGSNSVSVTLDQEWASTFPVSADQNDNILFLTVLPGEYTGDFVVTTDKASYTFKNKTVDFKRAHVRRFALNLKNAERNERITGAYTWELASGDLSTNSDTPKATATTGMPAMLWNLAFTNPYFYYSADRGVQIGSGSKQTTAALSTDVYGDEIKSIVINSSVASDGQAALAVYLDNKLLHSFDVTNTSATDYTFTPATPVKAGNIRITMTPAVTKAMYLKSVTILSANTVTTPLATPAPTVEGTTVHWEAVPNAAGYRYTLDGGQTPVEATGTSIDCSAWAPGTYAVQVKAVSANPLYADSEWSQAVSVTIENTATGARYVKISANLDDWTGSYLIAYVDGTSAKVFSGKDGNIGGVADISSKLQEDGSILSDDITNGYACAIAPSANGYSILSADGYIGYTASATSTSGSNYLYFSPTFNERQYEWTLAVSGGNATVKNVYNLNRTLRFNTDRFVPYGNTTGKPVHLYQLEDKTPRIVVKEADKSLTVAAADALVGSIPFTPKNLTGDVAATVTEAAGDWFSATVDNANGKVDWTASPNEGTTPRTATLTLSADSAEPVVIAVTQRAPAQVLGNVTLNSPVVDGLAITVSWNAVEHASGYAWRIVKTDAPDTDVQHGTTDNATTTVTIAGLDPHTPYTIHLKATGDGIDYLDSPEASTTATSGGATQLGMVTVNAPAVEGTTVEVSWSTVENASGYAWRIVETAAPDIDVQSGTTGSTTPSATIAGLAPSTAYTIFVKAVGDGSSFMDSEEASATATTGEAASGIALPKTFSFSVNTTAYWTPVFANKTTPTEHTYVEGGTITVCKATPTKASSEIYLAVANTGYFILPAFQKPVTSIVLKRGNNSPSGNSQFTLYVSTDGGSTFGDAIATANYSNNAYTFALTDQVAGAIYKIESSNTKAAQVGSIVIE